HHRALRELRGALRALLGAGPRALRPRAPRGLRTAEEGAVSARFADLHFARPELLPIGALACATAVLLVLFAAWRRRRALARFASRDALASLTGSVSPGRRALKAAMLVAALAAG